MTERSKFESEATARRYAQARPSYPDALFDALDILLNGRLAGADVVDVAAGTGIASRQLAARGARVTAVELSAAMLTELSASSPGVRAVRGSGNALPLADSVADLVTYAQAWHWMDHPRALASAARVLRPGGVVAMWWNRAPRDGGWEKEQAGRLTAVNPDWDADSTQRMRGQVDQVAGPVWQTFAFDWSREVPLELHLVNLASKSYVAELGDGLEAFLARERAALSEVFPDGVVLERFETLLVTGLVGDGLSLAGLGALGSNAG